MNRLTDQELLRDYAEHRLEPAFAELVRRHVDLVNSVALRMVRDAHLAEDVTQAVFVTLATQARTLAGVTVLEGWLHGTARNVAANVVRAEVRRRAREQEAALMNETPSTALDVDWELVAPHLDEALGELGGPERDALLLRYFKNQDFRAVGATLGITDDAAQKRVSRAVERLRECFVRRGVTVGAGGLAGVISANAVQVAPAGMAVAVSAAALGNAASASTLLATTGTIAMSTLQKTLLAAAVTLFAGVALYETRQAGQLADQVRASRQLDSRLTDQVRHLQGDLAAAGNQVAGLTAKMAAEGGNTAELLKVRGEVGTLRARLREAESAAALPPQPPLASASAYFERAGQHELNHEYEAQLADLNRAIELDPKMAEAYLRRGALYAYNLPRERGGQERALTDFKRCCELKPNDEEAHWCQATAYEQLGRYGESIQEWTTLIEGDIDYSINVEGKSKVLARVHLSRGRVYQYMQDHAKAVADLTAALELDPSLEGLHTLRGRSYEALGETEKARQDFAAEPKRP